MQLLAVMQNMVAEAAAEALEQPQAGRRLVAVLSLVQAQVVGVVTLLGATVVQAVEAVVGEQQLLAVMVLRLVGVLGGMELLVILDVAVEAVAALPLT
jgi:hypothetical protein